MSGGLWPRFAFVMGMTGGIKKNNSVRLSRSSATKIQKVAKSFRPRSFTPPFWARNQHVSTILGALVLPRSGEIGWDRRQRYHTPEGDYFDVEVKEPSTLGDPCVILMHGFESNGDSPVARQMAAATRERYPTWGIYSVNNRGCSGEPYKSARMYHAGFTEDLELLVRSFKGKRELYLMGFSLGGNMILNFLGHQGPDALEKWNIQGAAVMSVPFNLEMANEKLSSGFGRFVYAENFLRTLKEKVRIIHRTDPTFDLQRVIESRTVGDFDDTFIAPVWGFDGYKDYYAKCDSRQFLPQISVPTLVLHARDDPFIESSTLPTDRDVGQAPVKFVYHELGGHCSFISENNIGKSFAAEEFVSFVAHILRNQRKRH